MSPYTEGEGEAVKCAEHKLLKAWSLTCDISVTGELARNACNQLNEKLVLNLAIRFHKPSSDIHSCSLLQCDLFI